MHVKLSVTVREETSNDGYIYIYMRAGFSYVVYKLQRSTTTTRRVRWSLERVLLLQSKRLVSDLWILMVLFYFKFNYIFTSSGS